jgi:hypothetical protein
MKKVILSVGLVLMSIHAFPQTGGLGGSPSILTPTSTDNSTPSGQGFGGALGGATTTTPTNAVPGGYNSPASGTGTLEQQRMEDSSLRGGSLGGSVPPTTTTPSNQLPSGTGTTTTPATNVPSATGVGTGSPSGF